MPEPSPRLRSSRAQELIELTKVRVFSFLREPEAVFWVLFFPLILAIVLGWAFASRAPSPEVVGVLTSETTTPLVERLGADVGLRVETFDDAEHALAELARGDIVVLISRDDPSMPPRLRYDPDRPESELARLRVERALDADASSRVVLEAAEIPGSRYIDWLFPGLLGMNLMGTGIWGIGFAIAEMRQKRLLRRFLVTPMRRSSFLASFVISRGIFLVFEVAILVTFALTVLGVPLTGPVAAFVATCLLGTLAFAALGLLVASRARTMEGVSGLMNLIMLPMWLFSGVFFSYEKFPEAALPAIRALPLTALNDALRAVMLDGRGLLELTREFAVLSVWGVVAFVVALKVFRWK